MVLISACLLAWCAAPAQGQATRHEFTRLLMGVEVRLLIHGDDPAAAASAAATAFDRIAQIEDVASDWRPTSEVMRLCATEAGSATAVSDDLLRLLELSQRVAHATNGAFDVTIGPVTHLWRESRARGEAPTGLPLAIARSRVGFRGLVLDPIGRTATIARPGMVIDLGGIAQGYAAAEALEVLAAAGFPASCVDLSGDLALGEAPPGSLGWRVAIAEGEQWRTLTLTNTGVSTSGDGEQHVVVDGQRQSHIIQPATGKGVVGVASVTTLHHDAALADAMATAVSVLGPSRGLELAERVPGLAALIVEQSSSGDLTTMATVAFPSGILD